MSTKKLITPLLALFIITSLIVISGCTAAKKPGPTQPVPNQSQTDNNDTNKANIKAQNQAKDIAREVNLVNGVKDSTVVVAGNTAYIGLDIKEDIKNEQTRAVEEAVINRIRSIESNIRTVFVSSDVDTVIRLKKIEQGIAKGMPTSSFDSELGEIARRLTARTMKK